MGLCLKARNNQDMEATQMFINRGINKEDAVHIYNGILLSHKKEQNGVICKDVDGPRDCHTEWSQKEKKKFKEI